jgi:hypothetical protein
MSESGAAAGVHWFTDVDEAMVEAGRTRRAILIDFWDPG